MFGTCCRASSPITCAVGKHTSYHKMMLTEQGNCSFALRLLFYASLVIYWYSIQGLQHIDHKSEMTFRNLLIMRGRICPAPTFAHICPQNQGSSQVVTSTVKLSCCSTICSGPWVNPMAQPLCCSRSLIPGVDDNPMYCYVPCKYAQKCNSLQYRQSTYKCSKQFCTT